jgi:iron complex transport system permease protein
MLRQISLWKMGGLESANLQRATLSGLLLLLIIVIAPRFYTALNAMLLGESDARHLGFDTDRLKRHIIFLVAATVGISVAMAGTIAFIGLVVPHMVRILVGPDHRRLIPLSACGGAALLIISDSFARSVIAPSELPVGLVTSLIGAPVFLSLLRRQHQYGLS